MTTSTTPPDTRTEPPESGAERPILEGMLEFHRATFRWKCAQLTDEQLKAYAVPTSRLTLLGLLRHLVDVERWWFLPFAGDLDPEPTYFTEEKINDDFDAIDSVPPAEVAARWDTEVARIRELVAGVDLDAEFTRRGSASSLRWVYLHMIEEYARHNGHADLIREAIDGVTGE